MPQRFGTAMLTADDCLRIAWRALLDGDTAKRDRYCALAENLIRAGERVQATGDGNAAIAGDVICLPDLSQETRQ